MACNRLLIATCRVLQAPVWTGKFLGPSRVHLNLETGWWQTQEEHPMTRSLRAQCLRRGREGAYWECLLSFPHPLLNLTSKSVIHQWSKPGRWRVTVDWGWFYLCQTQNLSYLYPLYLYVQENLSYPQTSMLRGIGLPFIRATTGVVIGNNIGVWDAC